VACCVSTIYLWSTRHPALAGLLRDSYRDCLLLTTYFLLPTSYYLLLTTYFILPTSYYLSTYYFHAFHTGLITFNHVVVANHLSLPCTDLACRISCTDVACRVSTSYFPFFGLYFRMPTNHRGFDIAFGQTI